MAGFWIFFLCNACASSAAWARGGQGDGSGGLLVVAFAIFLVLYLLGSTLGDMSPGKTVVSGFVVIVAAALFGAVAEKLFGSPAGTLTTVAILAWVAWQPVAELLRAWGKSTRRATEKTQSKSSEQDIPKSAPASEHSPDRTLKSRPPDHEEFAHERFLQEQRRADADRRARALEVRKAEAQRRRNEEEAQHEAAVTREKVRLAELEQFRLDDIARQQMMQTPQDWYDIPGNEDSQHSAERLPERGRTLHRPSNNGEDLTVASGVSPAEEWPLLRADHWRKKGAILICLATGESFSPAHYKVENGHYLIDQKFHKGRLVVRDVKALQEQRK